MAHQPVSIETIQSTLEQLRQNPNTRRRFPQQLWDSIIQLTKIHPLEDVCRQLHIHPLYLKRKIQQSQEVLEFREITISSPQTTETVTIELSSNSGLKARIQGPVSCVDSLCKWFGR